jgi:hypothetical protein
MYVNRDDKFIRSSILCIHNNNNNNNNNNNIIPRTGECNMRYVEAKHSTSDPIVILSTGVILKSKET